MYLIIPRGFAYRSGIMSIAKDTFIQLTDMRAKTNGEVNAYRFLGDGENENSRLTFRELQTASRRMARALNALSRPGERVLLFLPSGPEFIVAFHACLRARLIAVPAFTPGLNQAAARIASIIRDCAPTLIITDEKTRGRLTRNGAPAGEALQAMRMLTPGELNQVELAPERTPPAARDIAFLQYTSGSTGRPRGVRVSHGNLMANSEMIRASFQLSEESVIVSWLPLFHDMGLIGPVLQPLYSGGRAVIMPPAAFIQKPVRWLRAIHAYGGTTAGGPDFAYRLCAERVTAEEKAGLNLSTWRTAFNGSEPVRTDTCETFARAFARQGFRRDAFLPCYGMAETTLLVSGDSNGYETMPLGDEKTYVSCGRFDWGDQELRISDPETGADRSELEIGEIQVRGSHVTSGYWGDSPKPEPEPKQNNRPWLPTGDLGFVHAGRLFIAGRIKDIIIMRGRNYYPDDLEKTAEAAHPSLRAPGFAAAFALPNDSGESLGLAMETRRDARDFDPIQVGDAVAAALLREFEVTPAQIYFLRVNGIPRTSSGKIRRSRAAEMIADGTAPILGRWPATQSPLQTDPQSNSRRDETDIRAFISGWLARRLNIPQEQIEHGRPMAAYGLDSIIAAEAVDAVQEHLKLSVEPWAFYEADTINALTDHLEQLRRGETPSPPTSSKASSEDSLGEIAATEPTNVTLPSFLPGDSSVAPEQPSQTTTAPIRPGPLRGSDDVALTDFQPYQGTRVIPQDKLLEYTAWMLAAVECVREGIEDRGRADEILAAMREKTLTYGVAPEYIARRQINVASRAFVDKPMGTVGHELPYLHRNLLNDVRGEPLETRMKFYEKVVLRILELWYPAHHRAPDDFVHVTCSGYLSPSPPQKLIARRGWSNTGIVNSYQMDCYGAFPAVRIGAGLLAAGNMPGKKERVDVIHTEFASLHCDFGSSDPGNIINLTLFGDGFIKYSLRPANDLRASGEPGLRIIAAHEELIPDTHDDMTWGPGSYQFNMFLSKNVPLRIREAILPFVKSLCEKGAIDFERDKAKLNFVIHPGGPRILNHIRDTLEISEEQVARSRAVLRRHGNMSSATVPHIWKDVLDDPTIRGPVISMAFGPGLTATGLVLDKI